METTKPKVDWIGAAGDRRQTELVVEDAGDSRPYVLLLHGGGGSSLDVLDPRSGHFGEMLFDTRTPHQLVDGGWHLGPPGPPPPTPTPVPIPGRMPNADSLVSCQGWAPFLNGAGPFTTVTYSQVLPTDGLGGNIARELHGVINWLTGLRFPNRGFVILGVCRGGIIARRWIASLSPAKSQRRMLRGVVTLHSPHQGSSLASLEVSVSNALRSAAKTYPLLSGAIEALIKMLAEDGNPDMALDSPFLTSLRRDEVTNMSSQVPMFTFGGTSTRFVRISQDCYSIDSWKLQRHLPPFHWQEQRVDLATLFDGQISHKVGAICAELRHGVGDLRVTDQFSRVPWERRHTTNDLSHAEILTSPQLRGQVLTVLQSLST